MTAIREPLLFDTYLRRQIWGGDGLARHLGKRLPQHALIGEAWELSTLPEHISRVSAGPCCGELLTNLWSQSRGELSGAAAAADEFPWLVKWLDCAGGLSLQVHPGDGMARSVVGLPHGKCEAWVIVHVEPGACVSIGLRDGVPRETFETHLANGTIAECLHTFEPRVGDCLSLPAGTVHTARGVILAEVQQPSDATFRLFDWNRLDASGQSRPLQRERGLQAIDWQQGPIDPVAPKPLDVRGSGVFGEALLSTPWVRLERYTVERSWTSPHVGEMTVWMVLEGDAELFDPTNGKRREMPRGSTVLIPSAVGAVSWSPQTADLRCTLLCIREPTG
ncbi:MAG: type I phosphomannose isomerase catalytic subunit [Planctomycetota bacterium]